MSDAELLAAAGRDAEAFGEFYDRHCRAVFGYFVRRTADSSLAADLTGETFAQAFSTRRRYRDTGAPATAWLYAIARRQFQEFLRQQQVSEKYRSKLGVASLDSGEVPFERVEELVSLQRSVASLNGALARLPSELATAIRLRVCEERSYDEVARQLGCSPGAARVRVSRALDTLRGLALLEPGQLEHELSTETSQDRTMFVTKDMEAT